MIVCNRDVDIDKLDVNLERGLGLALWGRLLRQRRSAAQHQQDRGNGFSHSVKEVYLRCTCGADTQFDALRTCPSMSKGQALFRKKLAAPLARQVFP